MAVAVVVAVTTGVVAVGRGVDGGVRALVLAMSIYGSNRVVVALLSGAESNGSDKLVR